MSDEEFETKIEIQEADEKRRKSLILKKNLYQQQQNAIKNALATIDIGRNNRKIFDEFEEQTTNNDVNQHETKNKKRKLQLFEDENENYDHENNDFDIKIKKQFEGSKGEKLLELQSKYVNDERFVLDSRFYEDDDNNETNNKMTNDVLRFDPSKPEHSKFELNKQTIREKRINNKAKQHNDKPVEVSKETFYKVNKNLKDTLKQSTSFSLLSMFGGTEENEEPEEVEMENEAEEIKQIKKIGPDQNPFRYDSSDTEDEVEIVNEEASNNINAKNVNVNQWKEPFFFLENDKRLKEGVDFLKHIGTEKSTQFEERSKQLRTILRMKVKHFQYSQKPFRKKIQSHKMIKVRKALRNK